MSTSSSFDPVWEEKYAAGHGSRYPWDAVVSFVFRNAPRGRERADVRVLELGCGIGANLWFLARENFHATGVDASATAVARAKQRLSEDGLAARIELADFTSLPFEDASFDLIVDRASLGCCGTSDMTRALAEAARVARPGGRLLFTPYADTHSSRGTGRAVADDLTVDISGGSLVGVGQIRFVAQEELATLLGRHWQIRSLDRLELTDVREPGGTTHAEWRVVAERV